MQDIDPKDAIPIAQEEARVERHLVDTGRVTVRTRVEERESWVREELAREDVDVEVVDIGCEVDAPPPIRTEDGVLIIPLFEEVLVIEKRLFLRQEIHLKRRLTTETVEQPVKLRRTEADVRREPLEDKSKSQGELLMRALTALFDNQQDAEDTRQELIKAGLAEHDIQITRADETSSAAAGEPADKGFMQKIKDFFLPEEDQHAYSEGIRRGGVLLTAWARKGDEDRALQILEASRAVDFDERQQQWRQEGWPGAPTAAVQSSTEEGAIPVAEERLRVGKREVERGSVRVRSYVTEEPVREQVSLREEHVYVERRPVNERVPGEAADSLFEERTFEATERAEEAVVVKDTVVTEEVQLRKDVDERTEEVEDTVRKTHVDVDEQRNAQGSGDAGSAPPRNP